MTPADRHTALDGKTFDKWFDEGHTPPAPGRPRHARASHARPGWLRSALGRAALYWQARKGLKARWVARNRAYDAETERLFQSMLAEQEAALLADLAEAVQNAELAPLPEDPHDVLTDEEWADDLVGAAGPSEVPADTFNHAPAPEPETAPKRETAYPDWATGQFKAVDAKLGAGQ